MQYLPVYLSPPLQCVQNAVARLIEQLASRAHVTSALREIHWLPVQYRITYKLCPLMHLIQAPFYLTDIVTATAAVNARARLRSGSSLHYEKPRTRLQFGHWAFSYAAPAAWSILPLNLQQMTNTDTFKRHLRDICFSLRTVRLFRLLVSYVLLCCFTLIPPFLLLAAGHFLCKLPPIKSVKSNLFRWLIEHSAVFRQQLSFL